jgi:hypothetical protein
MVSGGGQELVSFGLCSWYCVPEAVFLECLPVCHIPWSLHLATEVLPRKSSDVMSSWSRGAPVSCDFISPGIEHVICRREKRVGGRGPHVCKSLLRPLLFVLWGDCIEVKQ